ncbi:MAG: hypothetical protein IIB07_08715 [Bacteroidetes bacterium]|nr:hypothetical protein [Bacteroidota bacterium]
MEKQENKYLKEVLSKINSYSKRKYLLKIIDGLLKTVIVSVSIFIFLVILESLFHFSSTVRTILFFFFILFTFLLFLKLILPFILKYFNIIYKTDTFALANEIGNYFIKIKDELLNSLQLLNSDNKNTAYSEALINSAFHQVYNKVKKINFKDALSFKNIKKLNLFSTTVLILSVSVFAFSSAISDASNRLVNYNKSFIPPPLFTFDITPGDKQITKGEDVFINVKVSGEKPQEIFLATKTTEQTEYQFASLKIDSTDTFNYKIKAVRNSFKYYVSAKNIISKEYKIKVISRPIVKNLMLKISPPSYSKLPVTIQKDNGNITALKGSKIRINVTSTKEINSAYLEFNNQNKINLILKSNKAEGIFKIKGNSIYKINLTDKTGNKNQSPINYEIVALVDEFPKIELISPKNDVSLSINNRIPLLLKISDDFGFSKLKLKYKISSFTIDQNDNNFHSIAIPFNNKNNIDKINYIWNLIDLNLSANEVMSFYVEIFDNDFVSGPKSSKTKTIKVRIPSLNELLAQTDKTYKNSLSDLKETLKKAEELHKSLQKIAQNLKKNKKKIDWKEQSTLKQAAKKFRDLQKKAAKIADDLKKMKDKLNQNNLLSAETLEKYLELQKLMESLSNEEMKKAFEQMQNLLSSLDRKKIQDALKNFKFNEEQFKNSIERTLNLLKRIKVAQKIDELLARTKDIEKKEKDIKNKTAKSNPAKNKQLAKKQKQITKSLENFKKELDKLNQLMKELSDMPTESLDSLRNEFNKQKNEELSEKIFKNLQNNKNKDALQFQQQLSKNMKKMQGMVSQLQKEMRQKNQMETFVEMMKSIDDLISLSKEEENLNTKTKNNSGNLSSFKENAKKQNDLIRSLNRVMQQLSKLSQKTFAITPEMGKALGDARRNMLGAIESLQNRNGYLSANRQLQAMSSLNDASGLLKSSLEAMMKGGGQGGMMSLMQQLGQMAQQQMNLNNLSKMLQQNNGKFTQQQLSQLKRLQQQQELIRKSLQELNKEAKTTGKSKSLAADLDEILKQMQEVITNMNNSRLDDNVVQAQERILSKLLDAQRSVNERDYDKRRESFTGKDVIRLSPDNLTLDEQSKNILRDELLKAINEGYSKDYEELIKKYFEELEKKSTIK